MTSIKEYTEKAEIVIKEALEAAGFQAEVLPFNGVCLGKDGGGDTDATVRLHLKALFVQPILGGERIEDI
jgi:hypothetical protein